MILNILQIFLQSTVYEDEMELITSGKSVWLLVFWMGIVAPIAEEMVFRWLMYLRLRDYMRVGAAALISGVIFGIYHGNLVQAIYASILGVAFAYILEMSGNLWSSVLLHIGANTASLLLEEYAVQIQKYLGDIGILAAYLLLLIAVITGIRYFKVKGKERGYRAV
jgi:membrane protease YdiL (CAAX protease family)